MGRGCGAAPDLGIAAAARAAMPEFDTLRAEMAPRSPAGPRFLVGIPAVAARWPDGRPLHYVHAPLAAADKPPPVREAFYRPLAGLKLGPDIRFIAGFAHEDQDAAAQFRIRQMIEDAVGHPADVSTSCGLGRREPDAAKAAMDRIKLLLSDRPRPAWTSQRAPGHDHLRAGIYFRTQAPVLPVRPSAVARRCPGQLEALHLHGRPGGGRTGPRHGPRLGDLPRLPRSAPADHVLRAAARHHALQGWCLALLVSQDLRHVTS